MAAALTVKTLHVGVYKTDVALLVGDYGKVDKWMKKALKPKAYEYIKDAIPDKEESVEGRTFHLQGGGSVIWMAKLDKAILVHELFHAVHRMLQRRSVELTEDTSEPYAYLMEYLYKQFA